MPIIGYPNDPAGAEAVVFDLAPRPIAAAVTALISVGAASFAPDGLTPGCFTLEVADPDQGGMPVSVITVDTDTATVTILEEAWVESLEPVPYTGPDAPPYPAVPLDQRCAETSWMHGKPAAGARYEAHYGPGGYNRCISRDGIDHHPTTSGQPVHQDQWGICWTMVDGTWHRLATA